MPIAMLIAPTRPLPLVSFGALIAFVGLTFGSPAAGQLLLDQESPFELGFTQFSERRAAQTFTVGLPGVLESVEVYVSQVDPTGNLLLSLHALEGDVPPIALDALPLATGSIPTAELPSSSAGGTGPAWIWIDLDEPLPVFAGERLALVLRKDSGGTVGAGQIVWFGNPGSYAGGLALRYDAGGIVFCPNPPCDPPFEPPSWKSYASLGDFGFRTYVPEPAPAPPLAAAALALVCLGRRAIKPSGTRSSRP